MPDINDQELGELVELLFGIKECTTLYVNGGQKDRLSDAGLVHLGKLQQVRRLGVGSQKITGKGIREIAKPSKLTDLGLDGVHIDSGALGLIKERLTTLATLDLYPLSITDEDIDELSKMDQLRSLGLNLTFESDRILRHLQKIPLQQMTVRELGKIEEATLQVLSEHPTLTRLSWHGCDLDDADLAILADMTSLQELSFSKTSVTESGANTLFSQKPNLTIKVNDKFIGR